MVCYLCLFIRFDRWLITDLSVKLNSDVRSLMLGVVVIRAIPGLFHVHLLEVNDIILSLHLKLLHHFRI